MIRRPVHDRTESFKRTLNSVCRRIVLRSTDSRLVRSETIEHGRQTDRVSCRCCTAVAVIRRRRLKAEAAAPLSTKSRRE